MRKPSRVDHIAWICCCTLFSRTELCVSYCRIETWTDCFSRSSLFLGSGGLSKFIACACSRIFPERLFDLRSADCLSRKEVAFWVAVAGTPSLASSKPLVETFYLLCAVLLHEYTHILGRGSDESDGHFLIITLVFGTSQRSIPDVNTTPENYHFQSASCLSAIYGPQLALRNAERYSLLGPFLKYSQCDWRDGTCRSQN
jgi:hypothetical protein